MKKLVALLLALCMVLCLFAGCTKEEAATEEAATEEVAEEAATEEVAEEAPAEEEPAEEAAAEGMMIGWTFPTSNNEFWQIQKGYFETTCNQFGLEFYSDDCNNDTAEQLADVEAMISKGIDALILAPQDASVIATVCGLCKDAGIPVIVIDRMPDDDVVAGEDYVCFIGPDDTTCGYNQTVALIESGCTKLVALCGFKGTSVAEGRYAGLTAALEEYPEVELLGEDWCGENMDDGDEAIRNLYSAYPEMDGVWCYNDSLGLAATNVMKEFGVIADVHCGGMDGLSDAAASIQSGEMFYTSGGHYMMASMATVVLYDYVNGVEYTEDLVIKLSLLGINPDTVDTYIANYIESSDAIDWTALSKAKGNAGEYGFATMLTFDGADTGDAEEEVAAIDTTILFEADDSMINTYSALAVNPEAAFADADGNAVSDVAVNTAGADALIQWLMTEEAKAIAGEFGQAAYGDYLFYILEDGASYEGEIAAATEETKVIRLSTTTSVNDSGLLGELIPAFEEAYGYTVEIQSAGTGKAIAAAKMGNADLILVHSKKQEEAFIEEGFARIVDGFDAERLSFLYNYYVLCGPSADPAGAASCETVLDSFAAIAAGEYAFISRGDASGTHTKELSLWPADLGITEEAESFVDYTGWYTSANTGMGACLVMAEEMGAYILTDKATFLTFRANGGIME